MKKVIWAPIKWQNFSLNVFAGFQKFDPGQKILLEIGDYDFCILFLYTVAATTTAIGATYLL